MARQLGLSLPADLDTVLGTDDTFAFRDLPGMPSLALMVGTASADKGMNLAHRLLGKSAHVVKTHSGYLVTNRTGYADQLTGPHAATLGSTPAFKLAVPDAANATALGYVNLARLIAGVPGASAKDKADWKNLSALGLSAHTTRDGGTFTLRLTTK